jgi:hypothetical protein
MASPGETGVADGIFPGIRKPLQAAAALIETLRVHVKQSAGPWKYPRWTDIRPDLARP